MHYEPEFNNNRKKKEYSRKEAKLKAADYCAYQERSQQEVRAKLYEYGLHQEEVDEVLSELIVDGFINEERFARAYAGGKFRLKKWGKTKIVQGLKQHKISDYCIKKGLEEIGEVDYEQTLIALLKKKKATIKYTSEFECNTKLARFAIGKGFESYLVWEVLQKL